MTKPTASTKSSDEPATDPPTKQAVSLDDFAKTLRPAPGQCERWFLQRPELMAQVLDGLKRHQGGVVFKWLKAHHEFPFSYTALYSFHDRHRGRPA